MYVKVSNLAPSEAYFAAVAAATLARKLCPKFTGISASTIQPVWGQGWFGLSWDPSSSVWFQEHGTRPHTMRSLAGKTIPMWLDDPTGEIRRKNPKAQVRMTASGKPQVLLFRRAAHLGQRRTVRRNGVNMEVPASYPGAPGRIANRDAPQPWTAHGRSGGQIRPGNVGVRWRHPGIVRRGFLRHSIETVCREHGLDRGPVTTASNVQPWMR
jgi:hypothetical protein